MKSFSFQFLFFFVHSFISFSFFLSFFVQFFGFGAFAIYGYDAYIKYQGYQAGEIAQGERSVQSPSSVA